jgi:chromosomal replication initiator protein
MFSTESFIIAHMKAGDPEVRRTTIEAIQRVIADKFGVSAEELTQKSRRRVVAVPRQLGMYLAKHETDASLTEIGRYFGGMHHTTVMHAIAKMEAGRRTDSAIDLAITTLLRTLRTK